MKTIFQLKIAFVGVSHWHVPLYLRAVQRSSLNVVAVSDDRANVANQFATQLGCKAYTSIKEMLDKETPDFVFAFDMHSRMPALAMELISRNLPFSIEKPLGLSTQDVIDVQSAAKKANVFCSVPLVWRNAELVQRLKQQINGADVQHLAFRFVVGPPSRYLTSSPWMLSASEAGGGCMTNLAVHFIDLALYLTGSTMGKVLGSSFHYTNGYDIEDYATSLILLESGASLSLETGYAYPMDDVSKRDNRWNIATKKGYYTLDEGFFEQRLFGEPTIRTDMDTDSDTYYCMYTEESLAAYLNGTEPFAGLEEMVRSRRILDDIIAKAKG